MMKDGKGKSRPAKRTHPVLRGRLTRILNAFHLQMKDLPESVPYLVDNALQLSERLTSREIRQIGAASLPL